MCPDWILYTADDNWSSIQLDGRSLSPRSPDDAIAAGVAFVSEDRKHEGIIPELSIRENLTLAALPMLTRMGIVSRARQGEIVARFLREKSISISVRSAE